MRSIPRALVAALAVMALAPAGWVSTGYAAVHTVMPGETLSGIAAANGLSTQSVAAANGLSSNAFVTTGSNLVIPAVGATGTTQPAGDEPESAPGGASSVAGHLVQVGETLSGIAAANGISTEALAAANGLSPTAFAIAGTQLRIPSGAASLSSSTAQSAPAVTSAGGHLVVFGETLSGIAAANHISTTALAAANGLSPSSFVIAGTRLRIPSGGPPLSPTAGQTAPEPMGAYTVRPGDTLSGLAAASRIPMAQMAYMNGIDPKRPLLIGTVLKLPTGSPVATTSTSGPVSQDAIVPATAPAATPGRLTATEIGQIAAQDGVPASLAAAIAWQESGFNNAMVSSANARGVMQIMPGTWDWVQSNLARSPLNPGSPIDNVRAGSLYLGQLLRETNGDPALAAAGYYQGLASVRRVGMLPETQRYVANVMALRSRFGG